MERLEFTAEMPRIVSGKKTIVKAYSGRPMNVRLNGEKVKVVIDLATIQAGDVDLLRDHDPEKKIGTGESIVTKTDLHIVGEIDVTCDEGKTLAESTERFQASVGGSFPKSNEYIEAGESLTINATEISAFTEPIMIVKNFKLNEVSVLEAGADSATTFSIAAGKTKMKIDLKKAEQLFSSENALTLRAADLEKLRDDLMAGSLSTDDLEARIKLSAMHHELFQKTGGGTSASYSGKPTQPADTKEILSCAFLMKTNQETCAEKNYDAATLEAARPLSKMHVMEIIKEGLRMQHVAAPRDNNELLASGFSTMSLPGILNDSMNKSLAQQFRDRKATWRSFCDTRMADDFKEQQIWRDTRPSGMEKVGSTGQIKHAPVITEEGWTWQAETYAEMDMWSRQALANDDLGVLQSTGTTYVRDAMRLVSRLVYTELMTNPANFFSVPNGNLLTGPTSSLSNGSVSDAITLMRKQTDTAGEPLDIGPITLVVPDELEDEARVILNSQQLQQTIDGTGLANPNQSRLALEVESRLSNVNYPNNSAAAWYIFASPSDLPQIIGYYGNDSPTVETAPGDFNVLGQQIRCYLDVATTLCEHRAAVRSDGV